jgi:DNA mismatch repair protein MutL
LISNGQEVFHLAKGSLKQRIVQILGAAYASRLVTVQEDTDYVNIQGFVGKPDTAKRTRGDQYFFVNNRFIKSAYLNHAVMTSFQDMIPRDSFPLYVLFIDLDPSRVDINVHPTKQEIKFEDEKLIYAFVQAAVKHALAQFSITPSLDFDLDPSIQQLDAVSKPFTEETIRGVRSSSLFQTFTQKNQAHFIEPSQQSELSHWSGLPDPSGRRDPEPEYPLFKEHEHSNLVQLQLTYIICETSNGFLIIHQQAAHERVLYEKFMSALQGKNLPSQRGLFPVTIQLSTPDAVLLQELLPDLLDLGYQVESFGKDSFIIQGTPADLETGNEKRILEKLLEQVKHAGNEKFLPVREKMIRSLAYQQAVKPGTVLDPAEMKSLVDALFACTQPNMSPNGKPVFVEYKNDYLENLFGR